MIGHRGKLYVALRKKIWILEIGIWKRASAQTIGGMLGPTNDGKSHSFCPEAVNSSSSLLILRLSLFLVDIVLNGPANISLHAIWPGVLT